MPALQNVVCPKVGNPFTRLNNHRKDIKSPYVIEACQHFNNWNHAFHKHGKFTLRRF